MPMTILTVVYLIRMFCII